MSHRQERSKKHIYCLENTSLTNQRKVLITAILKSEVINRDHKLLTAKDT